MNLLRLVGLRHWQNLNERRSGDTGPAWRHGRAWFGNHRGPEACVEWSILDGDFHLGFSFELNGDADYPLSLAAYFGFARFWFSLTPPRRLKRLLIDNIPAGECELFLTTDRKGTGATIHGAAWARPMEWRRADPWWRKTRCWSVRDLVLGRPSYAEQAIEEGAVTVPMPEGCYEGTAKLFESQWRRRFGWVDRSMRVTIDVPAGIPHEGKGENSWDCGEDRTYGITCSARSLDEGVGQLVGSVLRDRTRYGGHRKPAAMAPLPTRPEAA